MASQLPAYGMSVRVRSGISDGLLGAQPSLPLRPASAPWLPSPGSDPLIVPASARARAATTLALAGRRAGALAVRYAISSTGPRGTAAGSGGSDWGWGASATSPAAPANGSVPVSAPEATKPTQS